MGVKNASTEGRMKGVQVLVRSVSSTRRGQPSGRRRRSWGAYDVALAAKSDRRFTSG